MLLCTKCGSGCERLVSLSALGLRDVCPHCFGQGADQLLAHIPDCLCCLCLEPARETPEASCSNTATLAFCEVDTVSLTPARLVAGRR